jgi:hypothetical protein
MEQCHIFIFLKLSFTIGGPFVRYKEKSFVNTASGDYFFSCQSYSDKKYNKQTNLARAGQAGRQGRQADKAGRQVDKVCRPTRQAVRQGQYWMCHLLLLIVLLQPLTELTRQK